MGTRPIFYDTETTGIRPETDRVVEIAAYDPVLKKEFVSLVNPGMSIPRDASAVHGITDDMVAEADDFGTVGQRFIEFCEGDVMLIAHNNDNFDIHFLKAEFGRFDVAMPEWRFFDTLKWARRYRKDLPRHALQFLREIYGFPANNAHRALDDVIILHKVYEAMTGDLSPDLVWDLIYGERAKLRGKEQVTTMPFGKHQGQPLQKVPKSYVRWLFENGALDKPDNAALKEALERLNMLPQPEAEPALS